MEEIRQIRLAKLAKLRELGIDPYPAKYSKDHISISSARPQSGQTVSVAGRLWKFREHGNVVFADLRDSSGQIQLLFQKKHLADKFSLLKLLDMGDFLGVEGSVMTTQAGEITIDVSYFELLGKSLRPLPDEWHGLKDVEERFRKRYLDLLLNPEVKKRFDVRTVVIRETRNYLDSLGFFEVETPMFHPLYGGANARPFTTHMHALDTDFYLRIAFELYLKRLVVGGYDKVYEIGRDFRNEGLDHSHNPEFTMLEWYEAYADYHRVMDVTEGLFKHLAHRVHGSTTIQVGEHQVDIGVAWPRLTMSALIKDKLGLDVDTASRDDLLGYCRDNKLEVLGGETAGQLIFDLFDKKISATLIQPTWVIDYPADVSPLSKPHRTKPGFVERFEGYIGGREICDGWSELTDPAVQRQRWEFDVSAARKDKAEAQSVDEDFLEAMEYGLPPLGGIGIGMDRLTMFFTNCWSIKEVILFPTLRPEKTISQPGSATAGPGSPGEYAVSPEVKAKFPGTSFAYTIIAGVKIHKADPSLETLKKELVDQKRSLTTENIQNILPIKTYRQMFKDTGVDYHSRRPSPEALLRRIIQGKNLYTVNTAVDAYNLAVIETGIGLGGFDLDHIVPPVSLRFSFAGETMHLLGDDVPTQIDAGELVYADAEKLLTLDLNYRDIDQTKITEKTEDIILFADGGPGIDLDHVKSALEKGAGYIRRFCGGSVGEIVLIN